MAYDLGVKRIYRNCMGLNAYALLVVLVMDVAVLLCHPVSQGLSGSLLFAGVSGFVFFLSYCYERIDERTKHPKVLFGWSMGITLAACLFYLFFILAAYSAGGRNAFSTSSGLLVLIYGFGAAFLYFVSFLYHFTYFRKKKKEYDESHPFLSVALLFGGAYLFFLETCYCEVEYFNTIRHEGTAVFYNISPFVGYWVFFAVALLSYVFLKGKARSVVSLIATIASMVYFFVCAVPLMYFQNEVYFFGVKGMLFAASSFASLLLSTVLVFSFFPRSPSEEA